MGFKTWFPVQKGVAEWMGDTKVKRLHLNLVAQDQLEAIHAVAAPGDILVARHNWYLSNVGLPGFWPHAELYVGSAEEMARHFDDPDVAAYFAKAGHAGLVDHLQKTYPDKWQEFTASEGAETKRIVEAVSEGVLLSSLETGAGADYVGVLRPRASKLEQALAINKAFGLLGRPYDFNFDFLTDESLVCTELVFKAWHTEGIEAGPKLEQMSLMGRTTLPANDIVRQFDERFGTDKQTMDFVIFVDGQERNKKAAVSTEDVFRSSWRRPKWDVLQK
jgi:uncharacterized protein YycO